MTRTLGEHIVARRKELGITQKELASRVLNEETGSPISPQYLNDIERDRRQPSSDHIIRQFAAALDEEADYLFYLAGSIPSELRAQGLPKAQVVEMFKAFRKSK
jgi:transcriptional regulator with XRE-family HTH domain